MLPSGMRAYRLQTSHGAAARPGLLPSSCSRAYSSGHQKCIARVVAHLLFPQHTIGIDGSTRGSSELPALGIVTSCKLCGCAACYAYAEDEGECFHGTFPLRVVGRRNSTRRRRIKLLFKLYSLKNAVERKHQLCRVYADAIGQLRHKVRLFSVTGEDE